ncbi:MAG: HNH endonuclease [Candidatus Bipolaricaulota bacterium]
MKAAHHADPQCIYCGSDREMSREDIVPFALGGRYASSEIICRDCNSYFGANVDCHITDWQLSLIARGCFALAGRGGTVPPYEVETTDGHQLTVSGGSVLRPKWRDVVIRQDARSFYFRAGTPTVEDAQQAIAGAIAKQTARQGRPPAITESRVDVAVRRDWDYLESVVEYDYHKQGRAIAKMAFHYLATRLERRFLLTRDFHSIMAFVRHGEHANHPRLCQPALPQELDPAAEPSMQHTLTLRCSRHLRSGICDVALFGVLRFTVVLSYSYEGPDLFRRLVVYPLRESWEEAAVADVAPVPARLILRTTEAEHRARHDRLEESVHALVEWLNIEGLCRHARETIPQALAAVEARKPHSALGTDAWLAAVADEFSTRSSPAGLLNFLGQPSRAAAEVLMGELQLSGYVSSFSVAEIDDRFARLIFLRLLVDALTAVAHSRCGRRGQVL